MAIAKKKQVSGWLLKAAILLIAMQEVGGGATTPALGTIQAANPDVSVTAIQSISTLPSLMIIVFGIVYALLVKTMRRRSILYLAVALYLVGGIIPAFLNDIYIILIFRGILGCGCGLLYPMANDLVVDFFDGDERKKLIGWVFAVGMLGTIFFQMVGGALAVVNWHYTFYAYAISIAFFAVPLIFLPEPPRKLDIVKGTADEEKVKVYPRQYGLSTLNLLWCMCFTTIISNGAIIVVSEGMGDAASAGVIFSIMTGVAFVFSLFFAKINKFLRACSLLFCYLASAAGLLIFYSSHTIGMVVVAMVVIGAGLGYTGANFYNKSTDINPFAASAMALGLMTAFNGFGMFISPYAMNALTAGVGLSLGRPVLLVAAIITIILGAIAFFFDRATPKVPESERPEEAL